MTEANCISFGFYFFISVFLYPAVAYSDVQYSNVTAASGIEQCLKAHDGFGIGLSAADFDADGDIDLFLPRPDDEPDRLLENLGDGSFQNIAQFVGLDDNSRSRGAVWFDYNNDQLMDLLVTSDCFRSSCQAVTSLLDLYKQNSDGTFINVTSEVGLFEPALTREWHRSGTAVADLNGDGFLDIVSAYWEGPIQVYMNQPSGTFSNVSAEIGINNDFRGHWQPMVMDFNSDGLLDIYFTVDFNYNILYLNQGTTRFPFFVSSGAIALCDNNMNDMGLAMADYDDDGDPDIYATNIFRDDKHNVLLENKTANESPLCEEVSSVAGVQQGGWGWGTTFFDANNDTHLDLAETNGWHINGWEENMKLFIQNPNQLKTFNESAIESGLTSTHWGSALLALDVDRDGDLDLIESVPDACASGRDFEDPLIVYESDLRTDVQDTNFVIIKPRIMGYNHYAIGAKVQVFIGSRTLTRWITAGTSFLGQEPAEAHFGLADIGVIDKITITWPDGRQTSQNNIPSNQIIEMFYVSYIYKNGFE